MTTTTTYNGWTNYETWCLNLWLSNDYGSSRHWDATAQDCYDNATADRTFTRLERATLDLADILKSEIDEANPLSDHSDMFADLLGAALSEVNYHEIASGLMESVTQDLCNVLNAGSREILNSDGPLDRQAAEELAAEIEANNDVDCEVVQAE